MKAVVIKEYGGPEQLVIKELPEPEPQAGSVVIEVKAFGLNHAETYFRSGIWGDVARVSGIECVGLVKSDPSGGLRPGQKVAAFMGGMGRTINGSYSEVTRVPASNVVPVTTGLSWADFAAIPESYATAWICLNRSLGLKAGQTLLVRGATSALGQAAINVAKHAGAKVIATTRNPNRVTTLEAIGADTVLLEGPDLSERIRSAHKAGIDAALELVGNCAILDTLKAVRPDGRVVLAGFLGGQDPIPGFNPLVHLPSGVHLSFFGSFLLGSADYPVSAIPLQEIVDRVAKGVYKAKPAHVLPFEGIQEGHRLIESSSANGKIVITL
jgi:NADPH:quinone reductase-like Zn-dependent oxidoreductase